MPNYRQKSERMQEKNNAMKLSAESLKTNKSSCQKRRRWWRRRKRNKHFTDNEFNYFSLISSFLVGEFTPFPVIKYKVFTLYPNTEKKTLQKINEEKNYKKQSKKLTKDIV